MPVVETVDHPHLPQRLVPVELLRHDATHEVSQLAVAARRRERSVAEVVAEIEMRIVDPQRAAELQRNESHLLAVPRHRRQLARDHRLEVLVRRRRTLENGHGSDVHVAHGVLDVQERRVEWAHPIHCRPFAEVWARRLAPSAPTRKRLGSTTDLARAC